MITLENIRKQAKHYNACAKVEELSGWKEAVSTLLSPQGREFAVKTQYPSLDVWRDMIDLSKEGVYLDRKGVVATDYNNIFVGDTTAVVVADKNEQIYHIMAYHGATVVVYARKYSVVNITEIGDVNVNVVTDGTSKVYRYER